jgi:hypothetical protein
MPRYRVSVSRNSGDDYDMEAALQMPAEPEMIFHRPINLKPWPVVMPCIPPKCAPPSAAELKAELQNLGRDSLGPLDRE